MAEKYFTFNDIAGLAECARNLGVGDTVQAQSDLSALLAPVKIGGRTAGNRLAIHPMEGCDGNPDGTPGPLTLRRWDRFGAGGCKIIWGEAVAIREEARANPRQLWMHDGSEDAIARMLESLRAQHRENWGPNSTDTLLTGCQLTHSGRYSHRVPLIAMRDPALDPMTMIMWPDGAKRPIPAGYPVLSDDDLRRIEDDYIAAAKRAVKVGFDFLDIKQCHRYLLSELLAAHERPGEYGGSFENRTRLMRNIFRRIRDEVSRDVILATRINICDFVPFTKGPDGRGVPRPYPLPYKWAFGVNQNNPLEPDLTEPLQLISALRDCGVSLVNLSMANPYANPHFGRPFELPPPDGYESPEHPLIGVARHFKLAGELQKANPDMVMIGTGYSWLRHLFLECAASNIARGMITVAGVGRGAFAYPDFVRDIAVHGKIVPAKACIAVSSCTALMRMKNNELGQFPSGCVPKDALYKPVYTEAVKALKDASQPQPEKKKGGVLGSLGG